MAKNTGKRAEAMERIDAAGGPEAGSPAARAMTSHFPDPPPGGSGIQPPASEQRAASWLEVVRSLAVEVEQTCQRLAAAAELAAQAFSRIAETYERANAELDDLPLIDCAECGIAHAASEIFVTTWDQQICRQCWDQVTNGAPLPDEPDPT